MTAPAPAPVPAPAPAPGTDDAPSTSVLVGRFQPFHRAHLALLRRALALAPTCVVVIGSAHQARTPKNPFTWAERAEMIRLALPEADRARVRFLPVRDYYDEARWMRAVRAGVAALTGAGAGAGTGTGTGTGANTDVVLVGHLKDATSAYLRSFAGWRLEAVEAREDGDGRAVRDAWLGATDDALDATLAALCELLPPTTTAFLRAWAALPFRASLSEEWRALRRYHESWSSAPYPPVFVTVDAVVRCADHVLLVRRGAAPGRGLWAVPGGFIETRETAWQSTLRELDEETHLHLLEGSMRLALRATAVFDHPDRSLRGRTITHAHYFDLGERELPEVRADDDAQSVAWVPISRLASMEDRFHDDHFHMLDHFLGLTTNDDAAPVTA